MIATVPKELKSNSRYKRNRGLKAMLIKSLFLTYLFQISQSSKQGKRNNEKHAESCSCLLPDVLRIQVSWPKRICLHNTFELAEGHC